MLPEPLHAVVVGTLLGDACLEQNGRWWRLRIDHRIEDVEYVRWKYKMLLPIVANPPRQILVWDQRTRRYYGHVRFDTRSIPELGWYAERFYVNGCKGVPHDIRRLLSSPLALAVWYMDDGHRRRDCRALRLNTQAFGFEEVERLIEALEGNFGIEARPHRVSGNQWVIYIPAKEAPRFCDLIRQHIPPEMGYKLL